ncbi:MAG TPA: response regulator [Pyrinomonadaceae bacterium]|jgi:DNA-binding response OmpR family regulator|nr:response regulator [Pyrinomonadaceae bacterium]
MNEVKILIIEDERHIARFLEFILQKEGYQIFVVNNGKAALNALAQFEPNAVLLDLGLPDMNGIDVLKHIRLSEKLAATKVLVLTATLYGSISEELDRAGADAQCSKPIAPTTLLRTLESFNLTN